MGSGTDLRSWSARAAVRVLMIDPGGRLLLFQDSDAPAGALFWITPGGGIDPGESELDAVVRELFEETGQHIDAGAVHGPIARQRVVHGYSDRIVEQQDTYYAVRTSPFEVSTAGHTEEELRTMLGHRWWTREALAATDDVLWPGALIDIWQLADQPSRLPVDLPDVEESTVRVTAADLAARRA